MRCSPVFCIVIGNSFCSRGMSSYAARHFDACVSPASRFHNSRISITSLPIIDFYIFYFRRGIIARSAWCLTMSQHRTMKRCNTGHRRGGIFSPASSNDMRACRAVLSLAIMASRRLSLSYIFMRRCAMTLDVSGEVSSLYNFSQVMHRLSAFTYVLLEYVGYRMLWWQPAPRLLSIE